MHIHYFFLGSLREEVCFVTSVPKGINNLMMEGKMFEKEIKEREEEMGRCLKDCSSKAGYCDTCWDVHMESQIYKDAQDKVEKRDKEFIRFLEGRIHGLQEWLKDSTHKEMTKVQIANFFECLNRFRDEVLGDKQSAIFGIWGMSIK